MRGLFGSLGKMSLIISEIAFADLFVHSKPSYLIVYVTITGDRLREFVFNAVECAGE